MGPQHLYQPDPISVASHHCIQSLEKENQMKRLLLALALLLPSAAHAQSTKAALTTEINTNLASAQSGGITAVQLRTTFLDMLNSIMPTAPVVTGDFACFDGTTGLLKDCANVPVGN